MIWTFEVLEGASGKGVKGFRGGAKLEATSFRAAPELHR